MSKYEDLAEAIHNDGIDAYWDEILAVLSWLDDHPDQVPGRTITVSEFERVVNSCKTEDYTVPPHTFAARLGLTIIPDPKPTNAMELSRLEREWKTHQCRPGESFIDFLDRKGVKAPGGDDD